MLWNDDLSTWVGPGEVGLVRWWEVPFFTMHHASTFTLGITASVKQEQFKRWAFSFQIPLSVYLYTSAGPLSECKPITSPELCCFLFLTADASFLLQINHLDRRINIWAVTVETIYTNSTVTCKYRYNTDINFRYWLSTFCVLKYAWHICYNNHKRLLLPYMMMIGIFPPFCSGAFDCSLLQLHPFCYKDNRKSINSCAVTVVDNLYNFNS